MSTSIPEFREIVYSYYHVHKRDLPWRNTHDPYEIMVSEFMLQQTQIPRVLPKYTAWLERFPTIETLSQADFTDVVVLWQGLGYNRRALFLQRTAQHIQSEFAGQVPLNPETLDRFPGIGTYTARAIYTFATNKPSVFIETNIRSAVLHHFFPDQSDVADTEILHVIAATLDRDQPREWYYALMDYGAYLKKQLPNPSRRSKHHQLQSQFAGSVREVRGYIVRELSQGKALRVADISRTYGDAKTDKAIVGLERDEFIIRRGGNLTLRGNTLQ